MKLTVIIIKNMFSGSLVTSAWGSVGFRMEEKAFRYEGKLGTQ
jgi:hypothetical protein